jgi:hypothetical protein
MEMKASMMESLSLLIKSSDSKFYGDKVILQAEKRHVIVISKYYWKSSSIARQISPTAIMACSFVSVDGSLLMSVSFKAYMKS